MTYKTISEITPVFASNPDCPFNCVDCPHFGGIETNGKEIEVLCELENNE